MSVPVIALVADAVAERLNAAQEPESPFAVAFEAVRRYRPDFRVEDGDLDDVQVSVVPASVGVERETRRSNRHSPTVAVMVQQRVPEDHEQQAERIDLLLLMMQQLIEHLLAERITLATGGTTAAESIEHDPVVSIRHLDQMGVFTSVLRIEYRVLR
jgi:hypothetical protein